MTIHSFLAVAGVLALSACATSEGAFFEEPELKAVRTLQYSGGKTTAAIASDLRKLGFIVRNVTPTSVVATTTRPDFVNCGTIVQRRHGKTSEFAGTAPLSVIYTDADSNDFFSREVSVLTRVNVSLAGQNATLDERHQVSMKWTHSDGSGVGRQTGVATAAAPARFSDGTVCGSSNRLARALG